MLDFTAIDFETANQHRTSVCSVGLVAVRGGKVVERVYELIRPRPNFYTRFNTAVHGMSFDDTADAPDFPDVWARLDHLLERYPLVAHNSPFDEGCLKAVFGLYEMEYPEYEFHCTCRAARRLVKGLPNHKLDTVAGFCGFDLRNHHHALADAEACAAIALKLL